VAGNASRVTDAQYRLDEDQLDISGRNLHYATVSEENNQETKGDS